MVLSFIQGGFWVQVVFFSTGLTVHLSCGWGEGEGDFKFAKKAGHSLAWMGTDSGEIYGEIVLGFRFLARRKFCHGLCDFQNVVSVVHYTISSALLGMKLRWEGCYFVNVNICVLFLQMVESLVNNQMNRWINNLCLKFYYCNCSCIHK